jgi:hypothetical protein
LVEAPENEVLCDSCAFVDNSKNCPENNEGLDCVHDSNKVVMHWKKV